MSHDDVDRLLREDRPVAPSREFAFRVMHSVRREISLRQAIPFPWKCLWLGLAASAAVGTTAVVAAQDAGGQFCADTNITFFPGSAPGGPFGQVVFNGAKAAEAALGPNVSYVWSDWSVEKMITQFTEAVATQPDGIVIMGHPGDDAFKPLIDDAVDREYLE